MLEDGSLGGVKLRTLGGAKRCKALKNCDNRRRGRKPIDEHENGRDQRSAWKVR